MPRIPAVRTACASVVVLLALGCSGETPTVDLGAETALATKRDVLSFVEAWRKNKQAAKGQFMGLHEQLQSYESNPTSEHRDVYAELLAVANEINGNYDAATEEQVGRLKTAAEKLPGDVSAAKSDPN